MLPAVEKKWTPDMGLFAVLSENWGRHQYDEPEDRIAIAMARIRLMSYDWVDGHLLPEKAESRI